MCVRTGDGRLGLLIAQVCALQAPGRVTHFGRHTDKMSLVTGTAAQVISSDAAADVHAGTFDVVVEASGTTW
jgi:threonine dehydrogenase-like Zn-dependent dehydrogenase